MTFDFRWLPKKCIFVPCFEHLDAWVWVGYHFAYNEQGTMPNTLLWKKSHKIRCKRRHVKSTLFKTFLIPTHSHVMACQLSYWLQHRIIYLERNTNKGLLEKRATSPQPWGSRWMAAVVGAWSVRRPHSCTALASSCVEPSWVSDTIETVRRMVVVASSRKAR